MIQTINVDKIIKEKKLQGPVLSPQYFVGNSYSFHPQGLMSEDIFGMDGSMERREAMSWIDLNCQVIHPVIYDILSKRIEKKIPLLISGDHSYSITEEGRLVEDENGQISGMTSLFKNIDKINFGKVEGVETTSDEMRNKLVTMIEKNIKKNNFFTDKLLVVSPDFRPIGIPDDPSKTPMIDEMNDLYRRLVILSDQIKGVSGSLYDILSYRIQLVLADLYDWVKHKVAKKGGAIRNLMLGNRVDFSARTVITPNPELTIGEIGLPLRIACNLFEPYMVYSIVNSPEAKTISEEFHKEVKAYLGKELDPEYMV
ncbi:MAG: hypothetical protein KAS32_29680 [Candidatus Peribacteraceae bacterium]|nr:hypothetical protein [Candidatus Peribacteraceae bacterium]